MKGLKFRTLGLLLMIIGGFLFVWSVKYIQSEWPQIFLGLLSVFSSAMGFALAIMPLDSAKEPDD